jgi:hypothetical protein
LREMRENETLLTLSKGRLALVDGSLVLSFLFGGDWWKKYGGKSCATVATVVTPLDATLSIVPKIVHFSLQARARRDQRETQRR